LGAAVPVDSGDHPKEKMMVQAAAMDAPLHEHPKCSGCCYLGTTQGRDWYWCSGELTGGTMIMRRSSVEHDYTSSPVSMLYTMVHDHKKLRYRMEPPRDPLSWKFLAFNIWKYYVQGKEKELKK
jgi:hypothetical protein